MKSWKQFKANNPSFTDSKISASLKKKFYSTEAKVCGAGNFSDESLWEINLDWKYIISLEPQD